MLAGVTEGLRVPHQQGSHCQSDELSDYDRIDLRVHWEPPELGIR